MCIRDLGALRRVNRQGDPGGSEQVTIFTLTFVSFMYSLFPFRIRKMCLSYKSY